MLPRQFRLNKKEDFDRVWKKGRAFFVPAIGVKVARNGLPESRFGFIVALTVSKSAVQRNTIKRRFRGIVFLHFVRVVAGLDVIVMARPAIVRMARKEAEQELARVLRRAGVLRSE